jgi:hypothetical protein
MLGIPLRKTRIHACILLGEAGIDARLLNR